MSAEHIWRTTGLDVSCQRNLQLGRKQMLGGFVESLWLWAPFGLLGEGSAWRQGKLGECF